MSVLWTVFYVMYSFVVCANVVRDMGCFWVRCSELSYVFCVKVLTHPRPFPKGRENPIAEARCVPERSNFTSDTSRGVASLFFGNGSGMGSRLSNKPQVLHKCI